MRELARVIANEWMKLLRRRRFWITGILMVLTIGLFGAVTWHDHRNQLHYNPIDNQKQAIASVKQQIAQLQSQPSSSQRDEMLKNLQQELPDLQNSLLNMEASSSQDWRPALQKTADSMKANIAQLETQKMTPDVESQLGDANAELMRIQYNLDENVQPAAGWLQSPYQALANFEDIALHIFVPLLIVILIGDMVSGEATDGSIKLLLVRPVSRSKILLGKWLVSLAGSILMTVAFFAGIWVTAVAIDGNIGAAQPVLTGVRYTFATEFPPGAVQPNFYAIPHIANAHVISQLNFFIDGALLAIVASIAVATVAFFCSSLFKSAMASTAVAIGVVVVGFVVENMASHQSWVGWILSTHLNLSANWTGQLASTTHQSITLTYGLVVLLIWAVVGLGISLWRFSRRDVLNA